MAGIIANGIQQAQNTGIISVLYNPYSIVGVLIFCVIIIILIGIGMGMANNVDAQKALHSGAIISIIAFIGLYSGLGIYLYYSSGTTLIKRAKDEFF